MLATDTLSVSGSQVGNSGLTGNAHRPLDGPGPSRSGWVSSPVRCARQRPPYGLQRSCEHR